MVTPVTRAATPTPLTWGWLTVTPMDPAVFNVPADLIRQYGEEVIVETIYRFSPHGECAVCHRLLGPTGRFSLIPVQVEHMPLALMYPAHAPCASSDRFTPDSIVISPATTRTLAVLMPPPRNSRDHEPFPLVMVNRSVDRVDIFRDSNEHWHTETPAQTYGDVTGWGRAGQLPPQEDPTVGTIRLDDKGGVAVAPSRLVGGPPETWDFNAPEEFLTAARRGGHVWVALSDSVPVDGILPHPAGPITAVIVFLSDPVGVIGRMTVTR